MNDLAIIVVNWNTEKLLNKCIQSIYDTLSSRTYEICVIDNGSTDGSLKMLAKRFPQVQLIANKANLGFSKATNIGIRETQSRYICLVNSDVEVLNGCLERLLDVMEHSPEVGMIGPKVLNSDTTLQISCYGFPTFWNSLCYALGLDNIFPRSQWLNGPYRKYWPCDRVRQVDVLSGCFCLASRQAVAEVGLLDERFFMYMEDFDWCRRFSQRRWKVVYYPEAEAIHYGGGSSSPTSEKYWIERHRAMAYYWSKHHGIFGKWYVIAMIFLRNLIRIAQNLLRYVLKPSEKVRVVPKIKQSLASLQWLLNFRVSK